MCEHYPPILLLNVYFRLMKKNILFLLLLFSCLYSRSQQGIDDALGFQYYQQGQYEQAAEIFSRLFSNTKNDTYFDFWYNSLIRLKRLDEAEKITTKLARQNPKNFHYSLALGRLYQEKGQAEQATRQFLSTINELPAEEFKIRELANLFYGFQAYDLAITTFLQGRKLLKDEKRFTYELLSIYRFKKDKQMLIQEYITALGSEPELLLQAETVLASVFEDNADYQLLQGALLKKIQKEPQTETYSKLLIWGYLQQQQYEMALRQLIAQDKRIKDDGGILFNTAGTFLANKAYAVAIKAYEYLLSKGKDNAWYLPARVELVEARYQMVIGDQYDKAAIAALAAEYETILAEYGKTPNTVYAIRKLARLQGYYLGEFDKAERSLESALEVPGVSTSESGQIKLDLGDIYILTQQPWEAFLIYEQVAKQFEGQPTGNEAHYRAAKLSFYQGNFQYAKSQADILKASTSQLIANDALNLSLLISDNLQTPADSNALKMYADAELLLFRHRYAQTLAKLDSIPVAYPGNSLADDIMMSKCKVYLQMKDTDHAIKVLKELISGQPGSIWMDDALFTLAGLYENELKDTAQAQVLYQQIITEHPGSMFAAEARKRFRKLRGDNIGS